MVFIDRSDAGQQLAQKLLKYKGRAVIYALPRGGVVTGAEVAKELDAPLDLILVKKIGHPYDPEYAIGAVAENGEPVFNEQETDGLDKCWLEQTIQKHREENNRRRKEYFEKGYKAPKVKGRVAIIVDDGIATGLTMEAAINQVKALLPQKIIVAVPVAPYEAVEDLQETADELVTIDNPEDFLGSVGAHYQYFDQIEDNEVIDLLKETNN